MLDREEQELEDKLKDRDRILRGNEKISVKLDVFPQSIRH